MRRNRSKIERDFEKQLKLIATDISVQSKELPYSADFFIKKLNLVININGCFWHNHGCVNSKIPEKNTSYWLSVFEKNKARDYCDMGIAYVAGKKENGMDGEDLIEDIRINLWLERFWMFLENKNLML